MSSKIHWAVLIAATVGLPRSAEAQSSLPGDVAFDVPVNLTRLSRFIERVAVECRFGDLTDDLKTLSSRQEIPVSAGQVVGDVRVVVSVDPYAATFKPGQTLNYECTLSGLIVRDPSTGEGPTITGWQRLDDKLEPSVAVSPLPAPLTGSFVW